MLIYLGADHRGLELKNKLKDYLASLGFDFEDLGAHDFDAEDDYNDYALKVSEAVLKNSGRGILICGSAQGMCMQANRFRGIRAAICDQADEARLTREHNDANVLCLSADKDYLDFKSILEAFFTTDFSNAERHLRRTRKLDRF